MWVAVGTECPEKAHKGSHCGVVRSRRHKGQHIKKRILSQGADSICLQKEDAESMELRGRSWQMRYEKRQQRGRADVSSFWGTACTVVPVSLCGVKSSQAL